MAFNPPLLDAFTRANENPIAGNWSGPWNSTNQCQLASNALIEFGDPASSYWSAATFGPDVEVGATVPSGPGSYGQTFILGCRITTPGATTWVGYSLEVDGVPSDCYWRLYSRNGTTKVLIADATMVTMAAGDKFGLSAVGTLITSYVFKSGAWASVNSATNSVATGAGYIGAGFAGYTATLDDFRGQTLAAAGGVTYPQLERFGSRGIERGMLTGMR